VCFPRKILDPWVYIYIYICICRATSSYFGHVQLALFPGPFLVARRMQRFFALHCHCFASPLHCKRTWEFCQNKESVLSWGVTKAHCYIGGFTSKRQGSSLCQRGWDVTGVVRMQAPIALELQEADSSCKVILNLI